MAKAAILAKSVSSKQGVPNRIMLQYEVAVDDGVTQFASVYEINFTITGAANMTAFKNQIVSEVQAKGGPVLATSDLIIWGDPR